VVGIAIDWSWPLEQIADFGDQHLLLTQGRRLRLRVDDLVHHFNDDEQDQAMMMKLMRTVRKFPHARMAPCFLASASESAVTLDEAGGSDWRNRSRRSPRQ